MPAKRQNRGKGRSAALPRYRIFYGWETLTCFTGTRREIVNRLKRLRYITWIDTLEIFRLNDHRYNRPYKQFFTKAEWTEILGRPA